MEIVNLGSFLNEFAANLRVLPAMIVAVIVILPVFGYFYNRLMDKLHGKKEHLSLYVAIGEFAVILAVFAFSWKAGLLALICNGLAGILMIWGEFRRTEREEKKTPRRKRIPYAANGRIDDARMSVDEANRLLGMVLKEKDITVRALQLATISHELHTASRNLLELKVIQQIEE
jgi:hypothetical protein